MSTPTPARWAAAAVMALLVPVVHATTTVGDIDPGDWTRLTVTSEGTYTFGASAPATGGNPGSHWAFELTTPGRVPAGQLVRERHVFLYADAAYDPALRGALAAVTIGFDTRTFASNVGGLGGGFGGFVTPTLLQGGRLYATQTQFTRVEPGDWRAFDFRSTTAADWRQLVTDATPDFGVDGAPMTFGFRLSLGGDCSASRFDCLGILITSGLDNFRFDFEPALAAPPVAAPVPEPGTWALMLAGLAATAWSVRRKRPTTRKPA